MASLTRISLRAFTNLALHHPNPGIVSCFYTSRHSISTGNFNTNKICCCYFLDFKKIISIYFSGRIDFAEDEAFVKKTYTDVSESPSHFKKFLSDPDKKNRTIFDGGQR